MYTVKMRFTNTAAVRHYDRVWAIQHLLGVLRNNGQILGSEFPAARTHEGDCWFVSVPEKTSLSTRHANQWVAAALESLSELGIKLEIQKLGRDPESISPCRCRTRPWLVLFTNYVCTESPVRCGACFSPIPLYQLAATADDAYDVVIRWQSDYQACDRLQMNCSTGERFATRQLGDHKSSLSCRGRAICSALAEKNDVPFYYYLYRGSGRSLPAERRRRCPSCGSAWLAETPHLNLFDFKCDRCRLVSNIGWNVRR